MDKLKLETSIQFPFFQINENIVYSEVRKPSGVAYILLVLINESKSKSDKLTDVLVNFGVPKSLHFLFAETINELISQDILDCSSYSSLEFEKYKIKDFQFTLKGTKMFKEESIPTGINKHLKVQVFYDIAMNEFSMKMADSLEGRPLVDSAITSEFMDQFECKKDVEAFLNLQKGRNIGVKKEEIITEVTCIGNYEKWVGKYTCEITLEKDSVSFKFENPILQKFFDTYYTSEIIDNSISFKKRFKFSSSYANGLNISSYPSIDHILVPDAIENILKQKSQLIVTKGNYISSNSFMVNSPESLNNYDKNIEFIQMDMNDNIYCYIPGIFVFNNDKLGNVNIPLLLRLKINIEELQKVISPYFTSLSKYSEENFKEFVKLINIVKDYSLIDPLLKGYMSSNPEANIVLLNEIKQTALLNKEVLTVYKSLLKDNYRTYLNQVSENNLETTLKITSSIPKFLDIPSKDVLDTIFSKIKIKDAVSVYEALVNYGFDKSLVTLYVNPVTEALKSKKVTEDSLIDLNNFNTGLNQLKELTKIKDYKEYTIDVEDLNQQNFRSTLVNVNNLSKKIDFFRAANKDLFEEYGHFLKIFQNLNDEMNLSDAAKKNPSNINQNLIDKKITQGEYQFVFVNLAAKLEMILKEKYKLNGKLSNMLSIARKNGIIDKKVISDLHDFREQRNEIVHQEKNNSKFNADDLRRWAKEIFELEEN